MKVLRLFKLVAINLITFIVLLFVVNWLCGLFLKKKSQLTRDQLPNYAADPSYAKSVFQDYNRLEHQYEPFVGWKTLPYKGKTTVINHEGERTHAPDNIQSPNTPTIRFFGGSTMWGEGSDDQHTIPALVNKAFPQFNVFNHAQLAYNTRQELDALISIYSNDTSADIVVFYDGVNDAAFLCSSVINKLPAHRLVPLYREKLYVKKGTAIKELLHDAFLDNILRAVNRISIKEKGSPYDCVSNPEKAEEIAEIFMRNWELAHHIVTSNGGNFMAILQPAAFIGKPKTDHLELDADLDKNFDEVYRRIKLKISERNHPWIYDLTNSFDKDEFIYIDFCHVSPNGNEIIANAMVKIINEKFVTE